MLARDSFVAHTEYLPAGRSVRVDHGCGEGRTLKVEHKDEGFSAYCWRCSDHGWIPHRKLSLSEKIAKLNEVRKVELVATAALALPQPMQLDPQLWPVGPRLWLYKAGLSNDDILQLGFYWNDRLERVVMPVYEAGKLIYWQARGFDKSRAKYLNPLVGRAVIMPKFGRGTVIVLTEDILSAIKVGRVTEAWALMGTSFSDGMVSAVAAQQRHVVTMLDPDAGGDKGRRAAARQLGIMGVHVTHAKLPRDPKLCSADEIRAAINKENL